MCQGQVMTSPFWCAKLEPDSNISQIVPQVHILAKHVLDKVILDLFSAKRYWRK